MAKVEMLRAFVNQRLTVAAEEIFELFERTIAEYEQQLCRSKEENKQQQKRLEAVLHPQLHLHEADVQQLFVSKERLPLEQQERYPSLDQKDTEPPHIKEEQLELWSSQEKEQVRGLEEADVTEFPFTLATLKSENDKEEPESSHLHQRQTEQMETGADGEGCESAEPTRNSDPWRHLLETEVQTEDYSEPETDDSDNWRKTREYQSMENSSDKSPKADKKSLNCPFCSKRFEYEGALKKHMLVHTGEKPFSCSVCGRGFNRKHNLTRHMLVHTGEKPFGCSLCCKKFTQKNHLTTHMLSHAGEKPYSCSVCRRKFIKKNLLTSHMMVHTGEKPFRCSKCGSGFNKKCLLNRHMLSHPV